MELGEHSSNFEEVDNSFVEAGWDQQEGWSSGLVRIGQAVVGRVAVADSGIAHLVY